MQFDSKVLKRVAETKYLDTEITWRYRAIIRVMYRAYEKLKYTLYCRDILEFLKKYDEFQDYTDEQLRADLDNLVNWNNLIDKADTVHVKTLAEYMNKVLIYQLSPYTIEIERMLIQLESMETSTGRQASLEATLVEAFRDELFQVKEVSEMDSHAMYTWWNGLNEKFRILNENYKDYISHFYSPDTEDLMKTTEFLIFKETFIIYLRNFIKGIQVNGNLLRNFMQNIDMDMLVSIIKGACDYEETIPKLTGTFDRREYIDVNIGRYESMREWFLWVAGKQPLYEQLIDHTNEIIRKITRFALQIADKRNASVNRKQEYNKLLELFEACKDIEEAHKLSSLIFGVAGTRHILAEEYRETESITTGIYEEEPKQVILKPRVRNYREKTPKSAIRRNAEEKEERRRALVERRNYEEELVNQLIRDNVIDFKALPVISQLERTILLRWISRKKRLNSGGFFGKTEFGKEYEIEVQSEEYIELQCHDGSFFMPHFVLRFRDRQENAEG